MFDGSDVLKRLASFIELFTQKAFASSTLFDCKLEIGYKTNDMSVFKS
jgi:hypothetical protein